MAFIVPPKPKGERIPIITLEELATALRAYLPTVYDFAYIGEDMDCSNADKETRVFYYGNRTQDNLRYKLEAVIRGKAVRSWEGKLFNMPFDISVHEGYDDFAALMKLKTEKMSAILAARTRYLLITPLADRSISIERILRWENGRPVVEA